MSQAFTNLIPGVIFVAIFLSLFGVYYVRIRRQQERISARLDAHLKASERQTELLERQTEFLERQTDALERIAAASEAFKNVKATQ